MSAEGRLEFGIWDFGLRVKGLGFSGSKGFRFVLVLGW